jgi:D-glycero-D-manno-heptose 1,7-bisphosphate phosphatase
MLKEIAHRFGIDLKKVPGIGDSLRDLEAFDAVGVQPILVKTGKGEETLAKGGLPKNTWICENLAEATQRIITEYA